MRVHSPYNPLKSRPGLHPSDQWQLNSQFTTVTIRKGLTDKRRRLKDSKSTLWVSDLLICQKIFIWEVCWLTGFNEVYTAVIVPISCVILIDFAHKFFWCKMQCKINNKCFICATTQISIRDPTYLSVPICQTFVTSTVNISNEA